MARFFIERPIFAWVLAILMMMAGILALLNLPVAQFPPLAPPAPRAARGSDHRHLPLRLR
jgi:multidrug efflux pump subunit AcrB